MPLREGYFIGNVSTGRMDFRWFLVGNCVAILSSLATPEQATAIMDLIEEHWEVLIGEMPLKIAYQALEGHEWTVITMVAHGQHCFGCLPRHVSRLAGWRWRREPSNKWSGGC